MAYNGAIVFVLMVCMVDIVNKLMGSNSINSIPLNSSSQKTATATRGSIWDRDFSSVHEANEVRFPWSVAPLYHSAEAVNEAPKNPSFTGDDSSLVRLKSY